MLKTKPVYPEILRAVGRADNGSAVLMVPDDGAEQPIFAEFRQLLPQGADLTKIGRFPFYEETCGKNTEVVIATGEQRVHANLLLMIHVVSP